MGKLSRQYIENHRFYTELNNTYKHGKGKRIRQKEVNINRTHNLYARENRDRINAQRRQNYAIQRCFEKSSS